MSDENESNERDHIGKNNAKILTDDTELLKLINWFPRKILTILTKNIMREIR